MTTDNFCFYLQNRLIQTSQTGGQWYSDASPFSIPWIEFEPMPYPKNDRNKFCDYDPSGQYHKTFYARNSLGAVVS